MGDKTVTMPAAVAALDEDLRRYIHGVCDGDWRRVSIDDRGAVTIHNHPVRDRTLDTRKRPSKSATRVTKVPDVKPRTAKAPKVTGKGLRARGAKAAPPAQRTPEKPAGAPTAPPVESPIATAPPSDAEARKAAALERLRELGPAEAPEVSGAPAWEREPATDKYVRGMYARLGGTGLVNKIQAEGFQGSIKYIAEVLALEGLQFEDIHAAVRHPQRVELRPEGKGKGYPVLGLYRGDVQVIMGFQVRSSPVIIACYFGHLLGNDTYHRPNTGGGGGGARKGKGNPKTTAQLRKRLTEIGVGLKIVKGGNPFHRECWYEGQNLGVVTIDGPRKATEVESDWNRIQRKADAIFRRENS